MSKFTKACESSRLPSGASLCAEVEGQKVAVFNVDGKVYAIADTCTHRGGPLSEGEVDGTEVTCPWHGATFDLTTGAAKSPPAPGPVKCYEVRVEGDEIQIATS